MTAFAIGDTVAWGTDYAPQFAPQAVVRQDAAEAYGCQIGTVIDVANEEGTWFNVQFGDDTRVLTVDELVNVQPAEEPA